MTYAVPFPRERALSSKHKDVSACPRPADRRSRYLLDEEPSVDHQRPIEDAEHEERLPPQVLNGMRRDLREGEVEEPLRRSAHGNTALTDSRGEDLGHVKLYNVRYA